MTMAATTLIGLVGICMEFKMSAFRNFCKTLAALTIFVATGLGLPQQYLSSGNSDVAQAENIHRGYHKKHHRRSEHVRKNRSGFVLSDSTSRSGVFLSGDVRRKKFRRNYRHDRIAKRRHEIARYNRRVFIENELRSVRRSGSVLANPVTNGIAVFDDRREVIINGDDGAGTQVIVGGGVQPCPTRHNCGYRIYEDGTGPRIITPGVSSGDSLPDYDGISGPVIITLN